MFKTWLLDNSVSTCYVPYNIEKGIIYYGFSVISDECPGELIGTIDEDGTIEFKEALNV